MYQYSELICAFKSYIIEWQISIEKKLSRSYSDNSKKVVSFVGVIDLN